MNRSRLQIKKLPEHLHDDAVVYGSRWAVFMGGAHVATFDTWQECVDLVWTAQHPPSAPRQMRRAQQYTALVDIILILVAVVALIVELVFFGPPWTYLWVGVLAVVSLGAALHWYLRNSFESK